MISSTVPQSCKNIWVLLSGSSLLKSKEFIGLLLEQNAAQIVNGILYHKKNDKSTNIQELWKKYEIDNIPAEFIEKLSKLINLDPLHCHDLFLAFLLYEFKGTPKSVQNLFTNEKNLQNLLLQLHEFYLSERLFSLYCLKQILANYHENSSHPYQTLFHGFYLAVNKEDEILIKLIEQLNKCINAEIPNRNENGPYLSDHLINNWVKNNVMETLKILECILIYLKYSDSNGKFTKQLITNFQQITFFTRYQYFKQVATLSDSIKYENLVRLISFTQSLIIIELFKLNKFKEDLDNDKKEHYLIVNKTLNNEINTIIQSKCNSLEVYSPVLLSWMLIKSLDEEGANQEQIEYLGLTALNLNVFEYLNSCLHSDEFENLSDSAFSSIAKNVVGTLLSNFFRQFDIDIVKSKLNILFSICSRLFDDDELVRTMLKQQENCGLYLIYLKSFSTFNLNLLPFLELTHSIAKANQNLEFLNALTNLSTYSEYFNFNTPLISSTEERSVYQLNVDRRLFQENNLFTANFIVPKGSLGLLREQDDDRGILIEWQNLQLDALKILIVLYKDRIDKMCSSSHYNSFVNEISIMNNIFALLIRSQPNHLLLRDIMDSLYVLKLYRKYSNVPRIFIASSFNLFAALIELDSTKYKSFIWEQIAESGLFPYLVGLTKDQKLAGHEINASKIGELIMSEECMKQEYDLCCAYLNLLSTSFPTQTSSIACPLLVHVVSEIFPCFQQWHYKNRNDYKKIAFKCLKIFQTMLLLPDSNKELVDICRYGLLSGPAGETLLNIIVQGEAFVRQIIEQTGNTSVLFKDELIIMVRNSLSVLNRLLVLQEKEKNETFNTSTVEQALFSIQSSKPNMILVLTHYVFQRYDTRLATLAVTLLKILSKHFPMSLLACLGSEAESVRDHFLYRLEEVTEDIRLKIALLDFLSCCIRYQPGLIEMFLNSDNVDKNGNAKSLTSTSSLKSTPTTAKEDADRITKPDQHNCLQTAIEILEEKLNEKYFCPSELHSAAIKFIFTFWLQPHLLAIDSLKLTKNLWTLICFPIYQENNEIDDKLFGYIFKILAREIFCIKTLEKEFDPLLVEIFNKTVDGNHLVKLSDHIASCCSQEISESDAILYLLQGFRDFFVSFVKFSPFQLDDSRKKIILNNILKSILDQLKVNDLQSNRDLLNTLCEICVTFLNTSDHKKIIGNIEEWRNMTTSALYIMNERKTSLALGLIINIQTILCLSMQAFEDQELAIREPLKEWYSPWCSIFKFVYQILEKNIDLITDTELKLTCSTLGFFHNLFNATKEFNAAWLFVLRNNLILESMASLLCYLIENKINMQLINTIQNTFILFSTVPSAAHLLQITRIVDKISQSLISVSKEDEFVQIFELTLQLATSLLMTIKHHYVEPAINLISLHLDKVVSCLKLVRECPFHERIQEATKIMSLLCSLTPYKQIWIPLNKQSFDALHAEVHKTAHSLIAFLIRPNLLQYLIKHRNSPINANILRSSESKKQGNENVARVISVDLDLSNQLDTSVHKMMFILLLQHLTFLNHVNPNVLEVQFLNDKSESKVIDVSFSAPNIDADKSIGFGSLLYCVSLVVRLLNKFEKPTSTDQCQEDKQIEKFTSRNQLILILEASLSLLVSQAFLAQKCEVLSERDKLSIRRDLKTELASMLLPKSRHSIGSKRTPNVSFNSSLTHHKNMDNTLTNQPFIRFLMDSVEELLN